MPLQRTLVACVKLAKLHPAAGLDHTGCRNICVVHQQARTIAIHPRRLVRFCAHSASNPELCVSYRHLTAYLDVQQWK